MIWSGNALMESILVTNDSASIAGNPMRTWCKSFNTKMSYWTVFV